MFAFVSGVLDALFGILVSVGVVEIANVPSVFEGDGGGIKI